MKLGKKSPEFVFQGRTITAGMKWWLDTGQFTLNRIFCVHNVALDKECSECADSA